MLLRSFIRKPWKPTQLGRWSLKDWERKMELGHSDSCIYGLRVYNNGTHTNTTIQCQNKQRKRAKAVKEKKEK